MRRPLLPILVAYATLYLVWGSTYFAIKMAVETIPPAFVVGFRFFIGGVLLLGLSYAKGGLRTAPTKKELLAAAFFAAFLLLGGNGLVTLAERSVDSYVAALVIATTPLGVAFFNRALLGIPVSGIGLAGITAGLAGVGCILYDGSSLASSLSPGVLLVVAAVLSWSLATSLGRKVKSYGDVMASSGMQMMMAGGVCLVVTLAASRGRFPPMAGFSGMSWMGLAYLTVPGSLAFFAYSYLIANEPSLRVVSYALVNPLIAVLLGLVAGGEKAAPLLWLGLPLILLGVFLMVYGGTLVGRFKPVKG